MDCDPYKIGCANGILHLRTIVYDKNGKAVSYKAELRPGTPEDYVSFQAGVSNGAFDPIDYEPYDPTHPDVAELMRFFGLIFPDPELREFVLTLAAGCLEGDNREQSFYIMSGSGSNGKSKFINLMEYTLGDYTSSLSPTIITRNIQNKQAALTHLKKTINRRFISVSEPDEGEKINSSIIKQLSGGDNMMVRGLYKEQEQIKVSGKVFLVMNRIPPIESMDGATWRPIKVIPFVAKFLDAGHPQIDPEQYCYEKDPSLDHKLIKWRKAFFSLLVHYYETKYCPNGIRKFPDRVNHYQTYTESYNKESYNKFVSEHIRPVKQFTFKEIYKHYKDWVKSNIMSEGNIISENEMKERLFEDYGKPQDGKTFTNIVLI